MSEPRVSVITPSKDRPALLRRALDSVRAQTVQDWEAIVVDDGDGSSGAAARALRDPRVRVLAPEARGHAGLRNTALRAATAPVVHLLDDDDRWSDPRHLERVLAVLEREDALAYRGGWVVVEDDGRETRRLPFDLDATPQSLRRDNTLLTSGVAYRRALHERLGWLDADVGNYWDWDWFLRVAEAGVPLRRIDGPGVLMSWRGTNTSADPFRPERVAMLARLSAKHGLGEIPPKNHFTLLEP